MQMTDTNSYRFERYQGKESNVTLFNEKGSLITTIGNKAFLSCKSIEHLVLPDTITCIEDWAFAHMQNLLEISLPATNIHFGKKIFLGCDRLREVHLLHVEKAFPGISFFLATAIKYFPTAELLQLHSLQDFTGQYQWLTTYDTSLLQFLSQPDDIDFEPAFIGWFDIEDLDDQKASHINAQKRLKLNLAFQRLYYSQCLDPEKQKQYYNYLQNTSEFLATELCSKSFAFDTPVEYFKIWEQCGGLSKKLAAILLEHLPNMDPEVKSFLIEKHFDHTDFFDTLIL